MSDNGKKPRGERRRAQRKSEKAARQRPSDQGDPKGPRSHVQFTKEEKDEQAIIRLSEGIDAYDRGDETKAKKALKNYLIPDLIYFFFVLQAIFFFLFLIAEYQC